MTAPVPPTIDQPPTPSLVRSGASALVDNASRLGLTWNLQMGTVQAYNSSNGVTFVIMDGDTQAIAAKSMVGVLVANQRVYVQQVPPGGYFITGFTGAANNAYVARKILTATSASVTFSSIPTNLRRLQWSYFAKADNAVTVQLMFLRINGDSSSAYFYEYNQAQNNGVAPTSLGATSQAQGVCGLATGSSTFFYCSGTGDFQNWDNLNAVNDMAWTFASEGLGSGVTTFTADVGGGIYNGAGPYTSVTFFPQAGNLIAGSDFWIEGSV